MKKNIIVSVSLLLSFIGLAQKGAKIEFKAKDNTIDYGIVSPKNDTGIRSLEYTNTGNAPLIIYAIQTATNCSILSKKTETILPGKSSKIEIKYNLVPGPIRKTITVETNAINYDNGRIPLKIKGEVRS